MIRFKDWLRNKEKHWYKLNKRKLNFIKLCKNNIKWRKRKDNSNKQGIGHNFKGFLNSNKDLTKEIVYKSKKFNENKKKNKWFTWDWNKLKTREERKSKNCKILESSTINTWKKNNTRRKRLNKDKNDNS